MPDPAMSAALREAYASAPAAGVIFHTLELGHPSFTAPIRVVRDRVPLDARIEPSAAWTPGAMATFIPWAFDLVPPDLTATAVPQCTVEIDNVSPEITAQLLGVLGAGQPVTCVYRQYLDDSLDLGPEYDPPLLMQLKLASVTPLRIRATAGFPDLLNMAFPRLAYGLDRFPGLMP